MFENAKRKPESIVIVGEISNVKTTEYLQALNLAKSQPVDGRLITIEDCVELPLS